MRLLSGMRRTGLPALLLTSLVSAPAHGEPPAQVAVSPPRIEVSLDGRSRTESLHIMNLSDKPTRVKLSVANWDLDERNQVRVIPPTEQSLDQWLIVNPLEATIAPRDQQTVRLAVRPRAQPSPGEHRAIVYIEQQPGPSTAAPTEGSGIGVRYRMGVAIYGYAGDIVRVGNVHAVAPRLERNDLVIGLDVESTGNAYVRPSGNYGIWPRASYPGEARAQDLLLGSEPSKATGTVINGPLPELPVLAGTRRVLELKASRPTDPGSYVVVAAGKLADAPFVRVADLVVD